MSGRGRGINNAPAWMTRSEFGGNKPPPREPDPFGRAPRGEGGGWEGPPRDFRRGPPPPPHHRGRGPRRYDDRLDDRYDDRGGPPRGGFRGPPPPHNRGGPRGPPPSRGPPGPPPPQRNKGGTNNGRITFRSFEEEQEWVEERRRKRLARKSKFDEPPTAEQLAADAAAIAFSNPAATDFAGIPAGRNFDAVPQQTRHARRLYIGNLPAQVTEQDLQDFFRNAIHQALVHKVDNNEDPILSVYINHERRFCFLEFKTVEMATACLALDGIDIHGRGKVKVKRPNDYNPTMAPKVHPSAIPVLDVSRLGIVSGTVQDGPNKIFIGGLHYHLMEEQVLELLQAFGKVKAFHLVKNEPDSLTSKGYCFVEYADPAVTQVAVIGLNGMDLGGGKVLTARVAGERDGMPMPTGSIAMPAAVQAAPATNAPPPGAIIIQGYDVEALVDAAMGQRPMPTAPMYLDQFGMPLTRAQPVGMMAPAVVAAAAPAFPAGASALDIANAALSAAFGSSDGPAAAAAKAPTRILVLLNMVTDEDLATDDEYQGLMQEVREECAKFGRLLGIKIPRKATSSIQASAIKKIFLEYATVQDANNAERELAGRQFGPNVVQASYFDEKDYQSETLR
ncbi:unnamed protein product [Cylindrotheca closterium]|uniref:RRM domain-containing protein n=1 Tax=Cylindrotheca closterium TaxID=2856 RepID=A0AAD2FC80_9STRA|nr:unnamed protein product [Cylindrotheca closterium]